MLLKTKQVAEQLNCSETFVLELARSGKLRALKLGGHWRFDQSAVNAYLHGCLFEPSPKDEPVRPEPAKVAGLPILDRFAKRKGIKL